MCHACYNVEHMCSSTQQRAHETFVLEFSFACAMTGEDLAKLEPDQITALYAAVGEAVAVQAKLDADEKAK